MWAKIVTIPAALRPHLSKIEEKLGYCFKNKELLALAFIHRSYVNEHEEVGQHNERLEFIGDAVLGLLSSDYLYHHYPQISEGRLSHLRSCLVDGTACAQFIVQLDIDQYLLVSRGELLSSGRQKLSLRSDLFEAILAAIYLDGGLAAASSFFFGLFRDQIDAILAAPEANWKAIIQDYGQRTYQEMPQYRLLEESGPDHSKRFSVSVSLGGHLLAEGEGPSKKQAQQQAAKQAVEKLVEEGRLTPLQTEVF